MPRARNLSSTRERYAQIVARAMFAEVRHERHILNIFVGSSLGSTCISNAGD